MRWLLPVAALAAACAPPEPVPLLDPDALRFIDADHDPLAAHRPADVDCPPPTWGPELGGFEIQTGACDYGAFDQPLPLALEAGDALAILIWHDVLDAPKPAEAHLAITVGADVVWEAEIAIPGPSQSFEETVVLEQTPPEDARLGLHLHNHGYNSYRFLAVDAHLR